MATLPARGRAGKGARPVAGTIRASRRAFPRAASRPSLQAPLPRAARVPTPTTTGTCATPHRRVPPGPETPRPPRRPRRSTPRRRRRRAGRRPARHEQRQEPPRAIHEDGRVHLHLLFGIMLIKRASLLDRIREFELFTSFKQRSDFWAAATPRRHYPQQTRLAPMDYLHTLIQRAPSRWATTTSNLAGIEDRALDLA